MLNLTIPMAPFPQPRPRATKNGAMYVPKEARERRMELQTHFLRLTVGQKPLEGPIALEIGLFRAKKRDHRKDGDGDNYEKAILDAGNGVLWVDDRQVVDCHWFFDEDEEGRIELIVKEPGELRRLPPMCSGPVATMRDGEPVTFIPTTNATKLEIAQDGRVWIDDTLFVSP
jgi:Holliday junction resolvase RusA-like endonuclease